MSHIPRDKFCPKRLSRKYNFIEYSVGLVRKVIVNRARCEFDAVGFNDGKYPIYAAVREVKSRPRKHFAIFCDNRVRLHKRNPPLDNGS